MDPKELLGARGGVEVMPTVAQEVRPGDEVLWSTSCPVTGTRRHHVVDAAYTVHDSDRTHVRIVGADEEHELVADHPVVVLRGGAELLHRLASQTDDGGGDRASR